MALQNFRLKNPFATCFKIELCGSPKSGVGLHSRPFSKFRQGRSCHWSWVLSQHKPCPLTYKWARPRQ